MRVYHLWLRVRRSVYVWVDILGAGNVNMT
jgi:hypothetical protein